MKPIIIISTIVFIFALLFQVYGNINPHLDLKLNTVQMIKRQGYPTETHKITTEDGYILNIHRIPNPGKPPVLLNHGLLMSSVDYIITGPGTALGYVLYDAGYDVWLGNARGNVYSREHETLKSSSDYQYWQFSFHEMGMYDLPAEIDYILEQTGYSKLTYIGFSMGTSMFWVMASERPEYNDKILQMHALAPTAYRGTKGRSFNFAKQVLTQTTSIMMKYLNWGQFLPSSDVNIFIGQSCSVLSSIGGCRRLFLSLYGQASDQINSTLLPIFISHYPAGTSAKTMNHVAQLLDIDRFWQFNYGLEGNIINYNSPKPPEYNLYNVRAPVYMQYSEKDSISSPVNVKKLCSLIQNCKETRLVEDPDFVHLDFTWGSDAKTLIYDHIISIMNNS